MLCKRKKSSCLCWTSCQVKVVIHLDNILAELEVASNLISFWNWKYNDYLEERFVWSPRNVYFLALLCLFGSPNRSLLCSTGQVPAHPICIALMWTIICTRDCYALVSFWEIKLKPLRDFSNIDGRLVNGIREENYHCFWSEYQTGEFDLLSGLQFELFA